MCPWEISNAHLGIDLCPTAVPNMQSQYVHFPNIKIPNEVWYEAQHGFYSLYIVAFALSSSFPSCILVPFPPFFHLFSILDSACFVLSSSSLDSFASVCPLFSLPPLLPTPIFHHLLPSSFVLFLFLLEKISQ